MPACHGIGRGESERVDIGLEWEREGETEEKRVISQCYRPPPGGKKKEEKIQREGTERSKRRADLLPFRSFNRTCTYVQHSLYHTKKEA